MTYFYGGSVTGRVIEPTGVTRPARVQITTSKEEAALLALSEKGFVCEIRPIGRLVPDKNGESGTNFLCRRAKIVRAIPWAEITEYIRARIADSR